jgi:uncharacterized protein
LTEPLLVLADQIAPQPWRNGGGRTRELLTWPAGARAWELRISLAEVSRDGPFSLYPGIERCFTVIEGAGVRLLLDGREHRLEVGSEPLRFSGALPAFCTLIDGPTTDLNLMHAGGLASMVSAQSATPWNSPLPQRGIFTRTCGTWSTGSRGDGAAPRVLKLPAHCLLWLENAENEAWTFVADAPGAASPALWLDFAPRASVHHPDARVSA